MTRTAEDAFFDLWAAHSPLADFIPRAKLFIGEVPLLDEAETAEVLHPFATVIESIDSTERTSENTLFYATWQLTVSTIRYDDAREICIRAFDRFDRGAEFTWQRGEVLGMAFKGQTPRPLADGVWEFTQRWQVIYSINAVT